MNRCASLTAVAIASLLAAGCANVDRSRDIGNPAIPATVLAAQVCANCHGLTGVTVSPNFPNLAAQTEPYLVAQLTAFKGHARRDPAGFEYMWGLSRSLSESQIQGLAAYFSGQAPARLPAGADAQRLAAGRAIFENGIAERSIPACSSCHGATGAGIGPFPRIASQHADYLVKQLVVFQRTEERTEERPGGSIMKTVAHSLRPQDIADVAAYLQAMPGA